MESFVKHVSNEIPDRFEWAIEVMKIQPSDSILEIGCGSGILAEQICKSLSSGNFTAIDKSEAMIAKAIQRNDRFITSGIASFTNTAFEDADLPRNGFDAIVAFNVNLFWKNTNTALDSIKKLLKPEGKLFVFYQPPSNDGAIPISQINEQLSANNFTVVKTESRFFDPATAYCIIATPA